MTRRDYVKLAAALNKAHKQLANLQAESIRTRSGPVSGGLVLQIVTENIVEILAADNPRFSGERFWTAVEHGVAD